MSRLFEQDESTYTGAVATNKNDQSGRLTPSLTTQDRELLEEMYVYSAENQIDLKHVDALAADLARYRRFGKSESHDGLFDLGGHQLTAQLSATNQAAADRIVASKALNETRLDRGFIDAELDTSGHAVNHAFLERMIEVFSGGASDTQAADGKRGPLAAYSAESNKLRVTASADVRLVIPEPDYVNVDGVGQWRTSALAELLKNSEAEVKGFLELLKSFGNSKNIPEEKLAQLRDLFDAADPGKPGKKHKPGRTTSISSNRSHPLDGMATGIAKPQTRTQASTSQMRSRPADLAW